MWYGVCHSNHTIHQSLYHDKNFFQNTYLFIYDGIILIGHLWKRPYVRLHTTI